jgi:hypothetical protein
MAQPNEWTHYTDELPPLKEDVLFCYEDENGDFQEVRLGWYEGEKTMGSAIAMETMTGSPAWYPCTHWMRLPKLPSNKI